MPLTTFYRLDDRPPEEIARTGFCCLDGGWRKKDKLYARSYVRSIAAGTPDKFSHYLPSFPQKVLGLATGRVTRLSDTMTTIKEVVKDTRAFWVSTDLTQAGGGRTSANLYRIAYREDLDYYTVSKGGDGVLLSSAPGPVSCRLVLDRPNLETAKVFAIARGSAGLVEVAFLTNITADRGFTITRI